MGGGDGLIISARFSGREERCLIAFWPLGKVSRRPLLATAHPDLSGFLLMAYFALKVFPKEKEGTNSRSDAPSTVNQRPELITLGNYRFEITSQTTPPSNVIELYPKQTDRAGLR